MITNSSAIETVIEIITEKIANNHSIRIDSIERSLDTLFRVILTIQDPTENEYEKKYGTYLIDTENRTMKKL